MTQPLRTPSDPADAPMPPSDPPRRLSHVGHGAITYMDEGEGPVVVLVHGLPGSARDFRYLSPHLPGCRRLRVDLPGFGGTSRQGRRVWTIEARAALLLAWLDELDVDQVVVVGHSMGGPIALALADLAPGRVLGVGLLASPGVRPHRAFIQGRVVWLSWLMRLPGAATILAAPLRRGFIAAGFSRQTPTEDLAAAAADAGVLDFVGHAARIRSVTAPTLVAWAEDDRLVEPAISVELSALAAAGPRLHWPTGGHNIQKTHAAELGAALSDFVAACFARACASTKGRAGLSR